MDRSERGADIERIEEIMCETLRKEMIAEDDHVIIEGGGNG